MGAVLSFAASYISNLFYSGADAGPIYINFNKDDWDAVSNTPTTHLSFLIKTLLPTRLVGWQNGKKPFENWSENCPDFGKDISLIMTGSMAEGFMIPVTLERTDPPTLAIHSDVDVLAISNNMEVSTKRSPNPNTMESKWYFEDGNVHPGYTRICLGPTVNENDEAFIFDKKTGKYYLSSTKYMAKMIDAFRQDSHINERKIRNAEESQIHGPAITTMFPERVVVPNENTSAPDIEPSIDLVVAIKCFPWPEVANNWIARIQGSPWISETLVKSITEDGCHVVAVPSKKGSNPELEWRISFSAAEGRVAREAVTDYQRQCYIFLKIIYCQAIKPEAILSTYMLKSVFLHCEILPASYWKDYPGSCVLYILDFIMECLKNKHLPTYFVPENNLIDHLTDSELKLAVQSLEKVRVDPIAPVLKFTDTRVIGLLCTDVTFRQLVAPLLDDLEAVKKAGQMKFDKENSVKFGIYGTSYLISNCLLLETDNGKEISVKYKEAVKVIIDYYSFLHPSNEFLLDFVKAFGLALKRPEQQTRFFNAAINLSKEYPDFLKLRGSLIEALEGM